MPIELVVFPRLYCHLFSCAKKGKEIPFVLFGEENVDRQECETMQHRFFNPGMHLRTSHPLGRSRHQLVAVLI